MKPSASKGEYPGLFFEWSGDPVNLLSGSFSWNYTDFSMYGKYDLPFIRYYESTAYNTDYHYGKGWSSNYTYDLDADLLYADFLMPQNRHVYFSRQYDGTYLAKAGSVFSLEVTDSSYIVKNRDGTTYLFNRMIVLFLRIFKTLPAQTAHRLSIPIRGPGVRGFQRYRFSEVRLLRRSCDESDR